MRVTLVGVKKSEYKSKDGVMKFSYNYCGLKDFTRYEQENAECEGQDIVREWSGINFDVHPGDVVDFIYEPGYQDKATLVDIQPVVLVSGNPFTGDKAAESKDSKDKNKAGA